MAPPNPPSRDAEGGGSSSSKTGNVPGRIGRPPQWTSTRSRKLARLYMYTTLSVDKILKVLEDDVFKPRKNSAQKTIHNMLDHDPRYLRPESREDMNQRIRLLSASTQRTRRSKKSRDDDDDADVDNKPQRPSPLHQVSMPVSVPAYGDLGMHQVGQVGQVGPIGPVGHVGHVGADLGQPLGMSHHPYQQPHQPPPQQHLPPSTQPPGDFLPPPPHPNRLHEQPYPEFYHPQYQQHQHPQQQQQQHPHHPQHHHPQQQPQHQQHPQHQHLAGGPSYMRGWPDFYAPHAGTVVTSANDVDAATRLAISCAPFELSPHAANHGHPHAHAHAHGHPHDHLGGGGVMSALDGTSPDDGMHMSMYGQQPSMTRERRPSSAACSTASSDVSTQTIQDLKKRLSGCSTHYANQVANLLRRFTISSGSDDKGNNNGPPVLDTDTDPHRVRKQRHRRHLHRPRSASMSSSSGSSDDGGLGSNSCTTSDDEEDKKMVDIGIHGFGQSDRPAAPGNPPVFLGACGDGIGSPRLALPGDFFNAFRYRNEACPHHRRQNGESGGGGGNSGPITSRRRDRHKTRERRYWCAVTNAVAAAARDGGSFWVLGDGRLAPEAQALLHETSAVPHSHHPHQQLTRRDRFGHTLLHLFAAREGAQMQLLAMVLNSDDASLVAANTAGQTFLHLLAPGWFVGLHEPYAPLLQLLSHLRERQPPDGASNGGGGGPPSLDGSAISDGHSPAASTPGAPVSPAQLVYATDVYGRSFFHRLQTFVDDPNVLAALAQPYDRSALSRRDAFNNVPLQSVPGGNPAGSVMLDDLLPWQPSPPAQTSQSPTPPPGGNATVAPADADMDEEIVFSSEDAFIRHHESLLRIVTASDSHPGVEDSEGRNGLHCLAQAIVDKRMMDEHRNAISTGRRPPKKKTMDKKSTGGTGPGGSVTGTAGDLLSPTTTASTPGLFLGSPGMGGHLSPFSPSVPMSMGHLGGGPGGPGGGSGFPGAHHLSHVHSSHPHSQFPPSSPSASLLHTSADGPQMATRLRLVQGLLSAPTAVDVNHYDRRGQTVLTSFVVHIPDDQEDKAKSLAAILETLLAAGARIDGRNRRGETALLVAARLGRKIALTTLLDHGANVHVRDAAGHGVLDIIDAQCRQRARHDVALYGRLEACRVLLTSIKQLPLGVRQRPSLLDEWSVANRRGPDPRDLSMVM